MEHCIAPSLWNKLSARLPAIFTPGNSEAIKVYFDEFVQSHDKANREDPLGVARRELQFMPKKNMYIACLDYVERAQVFYNLAKGNYEVRS